MPYTLNIEERAALNEKIVHFNSLSELEKEQVQMEILKVMNGYICDFAYTFSKRGGNIDYEDYVAAGQLAVLTNFKRLKFKDSKSKTIETYLYYWILDACNKLYADMCGPICYSASKLRKMTKNGEQAHLRKESLNKTITGADNSSTELMDLLITDKNPLEERIKQSLKEEFNRKLEQIFGGEKMEIFWNYFGRRKLSIKNQEIVQTIISYIKGSEELKNILYFIAGGS